MSQENIEHFPVMLEEILSIITPQHGGTFVDCTFGAGGYSKAILNFKSTKVIAIDRDNFSRKYTKILSKDYKGRFNFYNNKFSEIEQIINDKDSIRAIILDLGFSMMQMKNLSRGFSFNSTGLLDMGMGLNKFNAHNVINKLEQKEIELILKYFGEERSAKKISYEIINFRKKKIINTLDLIKIINRCKKKKYFSKINQATKSFQAIRIFVNNEISELIFGLINIVKKLKPGSKLIVVTFHSLEDRIVKYFFKTYSEKKNPSRYLPTLKLEDKRLFDLIQKKPTKPSSKELSINKASRSAKLRYVIRNDNKFIYPQEFVDKFQKYLDIERFGLKF